jgi:hypothetical protein
MRNIVYNSIILTSCLFGSVYIYSTSLKLINRSSLVNKYLIHKLLILNGLTCIISGSIILYSIQSTLKVLKYI